MLRERWREGQTIPAAILHETDRQESRRLHRACAVDPQTEPSAQSATLEYHLRNGIAEQISCPTLVLDAEEDMFFKGQPEELYEHLTCPKTFLRFTAAEGAGAHCQVGAQRLAFGRIYDWLDDTLRHVA